MGYNKFSRFCYLGFAKWRFAALAHKFFLVRLMDFAQFALPYFAIFGIALLALCYTENVCFEMQIGDFNRNSWQFWLVFRVILSIMANFVNISVENSSVEKYAVVRICPWQVWRGDHVIIVTNKENK